MNIHIYYGFERRSVEAKNPAEFFSRCWRPGNPMGMSVRRSMGRFTFYVTGFDKDRREAFEIPQVRAFYQDFLGRWPYWFLACNLDSPSLFVMVLCCLRTLRVSPVGGGDRIWLRFSIPELHAFIDRELGSMDTQCRMAGFRPEEIAQRRQRVLEYFAKDWSIGQSVP